MKPQHPEPASLLKKCELPLSRTDLAQLMQAVLQKKASFRFRAGGFSMAPFIKDGDVLTVAPWPDPPPGLGDVAAFLYPASGALTVHRIVEKKKSGYRLKGDGAHAADGLIPLSHMIGIVRKAERNGRRVLLGLGPEKFLIALLSGPGFLAPLLRPLAVLAQALRGVR